MKYEFSVYQMEVDGHSFWVAESRFLKGCVGQGDTCDAAIEELSMNEDEWLASARKYNIPIPPQTIRKEASYSGKLSLRISPLLHEEASVLASELGISLNQYITDAIGYYNSVARYSNREQTKETIYSEKSFKVDNLTNQTVSISNIYAFEDYASLERNQM